MWVCGPCTLTWAVRTSVIFNFGRCCGALTVSIAAARLGSAKVPSAGSATPLISDLLENCAIENTFLCLQGRAGGVTEMELLGPLINLFAVRNKWDGHESMYLIFDCQGESGQEGPRLTDLNSR